MVFLECLWRSGATRHLALFVGHGHLYAQSPVRFVWFCEPNRGVSEECSGADCVCVWAFDSCFLYCAVSGVIDERGLMRRDARLFFFGY